MDHPRGCGEHSIGSPGLPAQPGSSPRMRGALKANSARLQVHGIIPADAASTWILKSVLTLLWDHPRGCGEHVCHWSTWVHPSGSSPRMRGAPTATFAHSLGQRIITADAGSTSPSTASPPCPADHPRGCGEHRFLYVLLTVSRGSSPRMRGARAERGGYRPAGGIIPADAGSTMSILMPLTPVQDHPRGCGEHVDRIVGQREFEGSSPRMRGAPDGAQLERWQDGIIPADAGSTPVAGRLDIEAGDHPCGCGEHTLLPFALATSGGSSPRMREALRERTDRVPIDGIIPADAGRTTPTIGIRRSNRDHPRGCGEHTGIPVHRPQHQGSSPRMRGARTKACSSEDRPGIIPADAGSTRSCWTTRAKAGDHPRGCGEHQRSERRQQSERESSPRMRGALLSFGDCGDAHGIIPADAGSTA